MSKEKARNQAPLSRREEQIRSVLREAGPRPAVAKADLESIERAARLEWQEQYGRQSRAATAAERTTARWLPLAAALALVFLGVWWWAGPNFRGGSSVQVATVESVHGSSKLTVGEALRVGAEIDVSGEPVAFRLVGGPSVRLDAGSGLRLVSTDRVELERGALYFDSAGLVDPVVVATAHGLVRHVGTQFEVRLDDRESDLRVRVREGQAVLLRDNSSYSAGAGEELRVSRSGAVTRSTVAIYGTAWEWVERAAPSLEIEGRTLEEYLAWVSRETGWRTDFADPTLAASAEGIQLHGSIEGLTPSESVQVVLPGSGLEYRLEPGELVILDR